MWHRVGILLTDILEERIVPISYLFTLVHHSWIASTLKIEAIHSCETSVNKIPTRCPIPEDGILQSSL
jgi:hypothetical protein